MLNWFKRFENGRDALEDGSKPTVQRTKWQNIDERVDKQKVCSRTVCSSYLEDHQLARVDRCKDIKLSRQNHRFIESIAPNDETWLLNMIPKQTKNAMWSLASPNSINCVSSHVRKFVFTSLKVLDIHQIRLWKV